MVWSLSVPDKYWITVCCAEEEVKRPRRSAARKIDRTKEIFLEGE
jgi:hypothetical protein